MNSTAAIQFPRGADEATATVGRLTVTARIVADDSAAVPWLEHDGHGPVSEWTTQAKHPGERVLVEDGRSFRYYDWREAVQIARRDGWDAPPYGEGTAGQRAARAVQADFDRLRRFCADQWGWVGLVLSVSDGETTVEHAASCWMIESDADAEHFSEVASDLLPEALERFREVAAKKALADAAPAMLAALVDAASVMQGAMQYFPKSIKNRDTSRLHNVLANAVRPAIQKATYADA